MRTKRFGLAAFFVYCSVQTSFCLTTSRGMGITAQEEELLRARYPVDWEIEITSGTKLASLVRDNDKDIALLPAADMEDPQPLPIWLRVYLRRNFPDLPQSGRPQYPRAATELLHWLGENQEYSSEELARRTESLREAIPATIQENETRAKYPRDWEVEVPEGTKLDAARKVLDGQFGVLPEGDLEDTTRLPIWFRVYLRKKFPDLATSGPYQYPRTASRILQSLISNPDSVELDPQ